MFPQWLHILSWAALFLGFLCALIILVDVFLRPQRMGIMNVVWPTTALFGGPLTIWVYFWFARQSTHAETRAARRRQDEPLKKPKSPFRSWWPRAQVIAAAGA